MRPWLLMAALSTAVIGVILPSARSFARWALFAILMLSAAACRDRSQATESRDISRYERGQQLYKASCIACHGDPRVGGLGPPVHGSSLALIRLKVTEGRYPEGYAPKRPSKIMPIMGIPKGDVLPLYCYLNDKCKACPRKGGNCKDEKKDRQEGF